MASDQTPIEKAIEALEASKSGLQWYAENAPEHYSEADAEHMVLIDEAIGGLAAHVEAQRPGKVLTDEEVGRIAWKCYPHIRAQDAGRNADMATKRSAGIELLRYARDNGYLAPAQPLTDEEIEKHAYAWADDFPGSTSLTTQAECQIRIEGCLKSLRERLNKLLKTNERE